MRTPKILLVAIFALALGLSGSTAASATAPRGVDGCDVFTDVVDEARDLDAEGDFAADGYKVVGKSFRKAAKDAPKPVKKAMKKIAKFYLEVGKADDEADALAAWAKGATKYASALQTFSEFYGENCGAATAGGGSGDGGSLTFDDETISLNAARCSLREQVAAGQKILFTGQADGTNAEGDPVVLDVSRYDASSRFAGDDISVDFGRPGSSDAVSWSGREETGTIQRSGSTLRATGVELRSDRGATATVSFEINC